MTNLAFLTSESPEWGLRDGAPVLLLLHGYGSNERDLPALTPFLPSLPWVSVRAPLPMPGGGAAWFPLHLPDEPDPQTITHATGVLWDWIDAHVPADSPIAAVGFSQGGLMATQLLRTRPERIAATVVLAGFVGGEPQPADARLAEDRPPVFWGRGTQDDVIWPAAIERTQTLLGGLTTLTSPTYRGLGHGVSEPMLADVRRFLDEHVAS